MSSRSMSLGVHAQIYDTLRQDFGPGKLSGRQLSTRNMRLHVFDRRMQGASADPRSNSRAGKPCIEHGLKRNHQDLVGYCSEI